MGQKDQEHETETPRTAEPAQISLEYKSNRSSVRKCRKYRGPAVVREDLPVA